MSNNIQLQLDVNIKGIKLKIKGEVLQPKPDIKELSLLGELPDLKNNLEVLLHDDETNKPSFYDALQPFVPQSLGFGVYTLTKKINSDKNNVKLTLYQIGAGYTHFKLKGVFSKELKLFSAGISHPISFAGLPLIGEYLKENSISNLEFVFIPKREQKSEDKDKKLDDPDDTTKQLINLAKEKFVDTQIWKEKDKLVLAEGFNAGIVFKSGDQTKKFCYPYAMSEKVVDKEESLINDDKTNGKNDSSLDITNDKQSLATNNTPAVTKKKSLALTNIKPSLVKDEVSIAIDANFNIGPFGLQLIGLGISFPVSEILHPTKFDFGKVNYHLDGLGISYETPTIKIGGAFLRDISDTNEIYNGILQIKLIKTEIIALGSYTKIGSTSSLFAFGYLGVNIPLHPAINILGLGLGFGLNRNFVMPPIAKMNDFPIVKVINNELQFKGDALKPFFKDLNTYITPEEGCYILMGAMKFESFKVIQTTAIIAVTFGKKVNINLLGVSKFEKKGAYNITLGFSVLVDIDEGIFMARGEFSSDSYILSPKIKITGGFAFGMWFKGNETGDFIVSLGGYHPKFDIPKHYPQAIPRIGVEFNIEKIHFSAKVYFAVTNTCMMAGLDASLTTTYSSSLLSADIFVRLVADFLIKFQPFSYEADASCQIHLNITTGVGWFSISFSFDLTAQLSLYGPDLGGYGYLSVSKFQIPFKFGENKKTLPFSQENFQEQYFPDSDTDKILTYNITSGIIKKFTRGNEDVIVVNPKDFVLEINSEIPITDIKDNLFPYDSTKGIRPVCDSNVELYNSLELTISGATSNFSSFNGSLIKQSVPKAIWNITNKLSEKDKLSNDNLLKNVCKGIRLEFKQENPKLSPVTVSLYDTLEKSFDNQVVNIEIKPQSDKFEILNRCNMKSFNLLTNEEIDYTDLYNTIDVYKYKSQSLGTYKIA